MLRAAANREQAQQALGDLLLAAAGVAAQMELDPEQALGEACERYLTRFTQLEQSLIQSGRTVEECSASEQAALWNPG